MDKDNYELNDIINRRINNYDFQEQTTITYDEQIMIITKTNIKSVFNVFIIYRNCMSKLDFKFK